MCKRLAFAGSTLGSPASRGYVGPWPGTTDTTWDAGRLFAHLGVLYGTPIRSGEDMVPMARGVNVARRAVMYVVFVVVVVIVVRRFVLLCCCISD